VKIEITQLTMLVMTTQIVQSENQMKCGIASSSRKKTVTRVRW